MTNKSKLLDELVQEISSINALQSRFVSTSLDGLLESECDDLVAYLAYARAQKLTIDYLAKCYDLIVKDTLREQLYFQRHGHYRYSSFDEVASSVYFDDEYMRQYMHGLALTAYLWPNHRDLHRFFVQTIPTNRHGNYLEIGPGHGMYMMTAMRRSGYDKFSGIDLSPTSVSMTQALLGSGIFGNFDNYQVYEQDFLGNHESDERYSAIVMGEVLEHVEKPGVFLEQIHRIATDDAFIFVTTPINAPAIDHIYLFDSFESIESLVLKAALRIRNKLLVPYPGLTVDESMDQALPINVALVLSK